MNSQNPDAIAFGLWLIGTLISLAVAISRGGRAWIGVGVAAVGLVLPGSILFAIVGCILAFTLSNQDKTQNASRRLRERKQQLIDQRKEQQEHQERKRKEAEDQRREIERLQERQQAQQLHVAVLARLLPPQEGSPALPAPPQEPPPLPFLADEPPPLPNQQPVFYLAIDGQKTGPMDLQGIARLAADRKITSQTLVWAKNMPAWKPIREMPELLSAMRTLPGVD